MCVSVCSICFLISLVSLFNLFLCLYLFVTLFTPLFFCWPAVCVSSFCFCWWLMCGSQSVSSYWHWQFENMSFYSTASLPPNICHMHNGTSHLSIQQFLIVYQMFKMGQKKKQLCNKTFNSINNKFHLVDCHEQLFENNQLKNANQKNRPYKTKRNVSHFGHFLLVNCVKRYFVIQPSYIYQF